MLVPGGKAPRVGCGVHLDWGSRVSGCVLHTHPDPGSMGGCHRNACDLRSDDGRFRNLVVAAAAFIDRGLAAAENLRYCGSAGRRFVARTRGKCRSSDCLGCIPAAVLSGAAAAVAVSDRGRTGDHTLSRPVVENPAAAVIKQRMRILFLSPRQAWPAVSGAKLRELYFARALASAADLTCLYFSEPAFADHAKPDFLPRAIGVPRPRAYTPAKVASGLFGRWPLPVVNYTAETMEAAIASAV